MVVIEIMVAMVIKRKCKGTVEVKSKCSASHAKSGDILVECVRSPLNFRRGHNQHVSPSKQQSGKWSGRPKSARRHMSMNSREINKDIKLERTPQHCNTDPLVRLIGDTNETKIIVDGVSCKGLVDSGAQMLITNSFAKALGLKHYRWVTGFRWDRRDSGTI